MISRSSLVMGTVATAALLTVGAMGPGAAPARAASPSTAHVAAPTRLVGTLQPGFASQAPATLVLSTTQGTINVSVDSTTKIVRRYNGVSALDELSPGDQIGVSGAMSGTNAITAKVVKDFTIQKAFTRNVAVITGISSDFTQVGLKVVKDGRFDGQNPMRTGQAMTITVSPSMSVTLGDGSQGTVANSLDEGMLVTVLGTYNRGSNTFTDAERIRVWTPVVGKTSAVHGILQQGFSATAPTTLTLQTKYSGLVTVSVDANTKIVRRYNGASGLDELSSGDQIVVVGTYQGNNVYSAKRVKDATIQRAYSFMMGQITAITSTTTVSPTQVQITVTVLKGGDHARKNPFKPGQTVTLYASSNTQVTMAKGQTAAISTLQTGMKISALGVVNRKGLRYDSVDRIRVITS